MTDYKEEQNNELEALESIYPDEIEVVSTSPYHSFNIKVAVQHDQDVEEVIDVSAVVRFTYTATYPDKAPIMEVVDWENLDDQQVTILTDLLEDQAEENIGTVMVFTLISAVQERLNVMVDEMKEQKQLEEERKKREEEEAEQKRFEGTRVTIETFLAWKTKFDEEMLLLKAKVKKSQKPTGRELFLNDASLDDSDVKFLQEDGDAVEVDESLFEEIDDLEIDGDD